jgi:hypothetical protein
VNYRNKEHYATASFIVYTPIYRVPELHHCSAHTHTHTHTHTFIENHNIRDARSVVGPDQVLLLTRERQCLCFPPSHV